jgi:hypothetical protein
MPAHPENRGPARSESAQGKLGRCKAKAQDKNVLGTQLVSHYGAALPRVDRRKYPLQAIRRRRY